jgi:hypothetical protein
MSAVNPKTAASLIALARNRRMQRALAHASLHRNAPMPTLRSSLGYMTTTARVAEDAPGADHRMTVLGVSRFEGAAYVVEDVGDPTPVIYRLHLRGPRQGHLVPLHAWYDQADDDGELRRRISALTPTLEPLYPTAREAWMLSTRIVQRRALRVANGCNGLPIRKFALQLVVEPISVLGPSGRTTVTAYLQPHAELAEVWALSDGAAIARVTYAGIPSGIGHSKDTVILLTSGLSVASGDSAA